MNTQPHGKMFRIYGEDAVLSRLGRLGSRPRTFDNLVSVGFPPQQLNEARRWYAQGAVSHVQHYAAARMKEGFFEDEPLLDILCRFFHCTDWKLEKSPLFFSTDDYRKFNQTLTHPVYFHVRKLTAGEGEPRWGGFFRKLPFQVGMERALGSLWEEILTGAYYWREQQSYVHHRAAMLLQYLQRTINILDFSEHQFNYDWERRFRRLMKPGLEEFRDGLERANRIWEERRRERPERFTYGTYVAGFGTATGDLLYALKYFGLEPATVNQDALRSSFRRLSKKHHPDQGGSDEDFRRLSAYRQLIENWLTEHQTA